ncbi:MAG: S9 family peptidase [Acidobacteriota bacterium]
MNHLKAGIHKALIVLALAALAVSVPVLADHHAGASEVERIEKGNLVIEGIPEIPEELTDRLRRYQNTRSAGLQGWHPDGKGILVSTRFGETSQIHWVREPGGARRQLTFFDEPVGGASLSSDAEVNGFLFQKDVGGSEFFQLFFFDLATGDYRMLSDGKSRNGGAVWSDDGQRYAYFTTRRNGTDWDIYLGDITDGTSQAVLEEGKTWAPIEFSPNGDKLLVIRLVSANESYPHMLDLASGKLTELNPSDERVAYGGATFSKDGKGIYFSTDLDAEFEQLRYYDIESGESKVLTGDIPWDVGSINLSADGELLAFTVNEGGISRLHVRRTEDFSPVEIPALPTGQVVGLEFNPAGDKLGFIVSSPQTPGDVYSIDFENNALERWTYSEVGGLDTETFTSPELVEFPTFDEVGGEPRMIPAFYYRPKGPGPHPVLIQIHGGPEGQARPFFNSSVPFLMEELGIAVVVPNVRGSSGYGKSYLLLDNGFKREDSVKDIGALLDWIEAQPELDASRMAVMGGSYGGYMVLASMVHYNDRLRAGIDIVGISNFVTFLKNTQDYRRDLRRVEYGDERDQEMHDFLQKISPNNQADKITKPMFIVQGLNDPRVPVTESEQMVEEIRKNGGDVWYLLAKDEGHGFRKKGNRDYYASATVLFLQQHLLGEGGEESGAMDKAAR